MTTGDKDVEPNFFGKLSDIRFENNGKRIIIILDRYQKANDYIRNQIMKKLGNISVVVEFTSLLDYQRNQAALDEDEDRDNDDKQTKLR